jgi:hypothetical protein
MYLTQYVNKTLYYISKIAYREGGRELVTTNSN